MKSKLFYNTITPLLHQVLNDLMLATEFDSFRLVGGTSLSLQLGHRFSVDIDLFTDEPYESIDFESIHNYLINKYEYVDTHQFGVIGMGKTYFVGNNEVDSVKLDMYYTDPFIQESLFVDNIRLASIDEIAAMKIEVIQNGGRKKDFWDLHELMKSYPAEKLLSLHSERYPYSHDRRLILSNLINFDKADEDFDPNCLRNKYWEIIKLDFLDFVTTIDI